jgi:hypothetical protein
MIDDVDDVNVDDVNNIDDVVVDDSYNFQSFDFGAGQWTCSSSSDLLANHLAPRSQ